MIERLIIHIGTHKTGTSALQYVLESERSSLSSRGAWYARTDREPFPQLPKHSSLYRAAMTGPGKLNAELDFMINEALNENCSTLILSEEGFSEPNFEYYKPLLELKNRCDIEVLCLVRRQDYFIESLWNQYCKEGRETRGIKEFSNAPNISKRCNYLEMLEFWSGVGKVHVADYDKVKMGGVNNFFSSSTGISLESKDRIKNRSLGMNTALVLSHLNKLKSKEHTSKIIKAFDSDQTRFALGSKLRSELLQKYSTINSQLSKSFGIMFSDDFPENEAPGPLVRVEPQVMIQALLVLAKNDHSEPN